MMTARVSGEGIVAPAHGSPNTNYPPVRGAAGPADNA